MQTLNKIGIHNPQFGVKKSTETIAKLNLCLRLFN